MIIERIKKNIDPNMCITPQSTPIIYFGNYQMSKACTISLNPSNKEFINNKLELLDNFSMERLCSRKKLNKKDEEELSDADANEVLLYCNDYFNIGIVYGIVQRAKTIVPSVANNQSIFLLGKNAGKVNL